MKVITVKEMKEKLSQFDDDLIVCILRDGAGDDYPILDEDWMIISSVYFPNSDIENPPDEDTKALRIGWL